MAEHDDNVTTDLNHKDPSSQLFIEDASDDDNSVARLSLQTMDKLQLFCGDAVKLKGKKRRKTICIVLSDDSCRDDRIRVNHVVQKNLRVHADDIISIQGYQHISYGTRIHVLPIDDTVKNIAGNILKEYLEPYFRDAFRPVYVGDTFIVRTTMHAVEFKVIETEPSPYCIVAPETVIHCEGEPIQREVEEALINEIDFDDIGGLEDVKQRLKEFIQWPIEYQEKYHKLGINLTYHLLLYGASGCGKTMLVNALANEYGLNLISIKGPELLSMPPDAIENNMHNIFDKARRSAPCILFIDDFDYICEIHHCNITFGHASVDRLINQMRTDIDGMYNKTNVHIVGATNRPDIIDPKFFRPGRFDQMIYVPLPDEKSRQAILKIMLQKWTVATDVDLTYLAKILMGLNSAEIVGFCQRAYKAAIQESIEKNLKVEQSNSLTDLKTEIRRDHFEQVMARFPHKAEYDIHKYEIFAQMRQPRYIFDPWPQMVTNTQNSNAGGNTKQGSNVYTDDDDLYA